MNSAPVFLNVPRLRGGLPLGAAIAFVAAFFTAAYGDVIQFFLSHESNALFLTNGIVSRDADENSVAEIFYVSQEAKIQALKNHPRLLEATDLLEKEFGLAIQEKKL